MKIDNTTVKTHICPTCGGNLKIDPERQMYECTFCGVTFDYEYFREDEVLGMAERAMNIGEADSAKRAYEFMLKKDPKNFFAIRGLLLLSIKIRSVSELGLTETYRKRNFANVERRLEKFKDEVDPDYREYYSDMTSLVSTGRETIREEKMAEEYRSQKLSALVNYEKQDISYNDLTDKGSHGFSGGSKRLLKTLLKNFIIYLGILGFIFLTVNSSLQHIPEFLRKDNRILIGALAIPTGLFLLICARELINYRSYRKKLEVARQRYASLVSIYEEQEEHVNELKEKMRSCCQKMKEFEKSLA